MLAQRGREGKIIVPADAPVCAADILIAQRAIDGLEEERGETNDVDTVAFSDTVDRRASVVIVLKTDVEAALGMEFFLIIHFRLQNDGEELRKERVTRDLAQVGQAVEIIVDAHRQYR